MQCTQRLLDGIFQDLTASGRFDDMLVIVHGDHGSRIELNPPTRNFLTSFEPADFTDGFSTLFAVHHPHGSAQTIHEIRSVEHLLADVVFGRIAGEKPESPWAYFRGEDPAGPRFQVPFPAEAWFDNTAPDAPAAAPQPARGG